VRYDGADRFDLVAGNGKPAALINVSRQPGGSMLAVQRAVLASADSIRALLPNGVRLELVYDQAALVRASLMSVAEAMLIGAALSALVLWLFLRRPGLAILAALSLPITVLVTFGGMALTGESLNLMSLGGLAVAIGLIIDDAVVVVENLQRRVAAHRGAPLATVIVDAIDEIVAPVAGSTLTTIVVFAPLALVEGAVGQFFRSFSLALSIAVALSFLLAVLLLPALASRPGWLAVDSEEGAPGGIGAMRAWFERVSARTITRPWWSGAIAVLLALTALGLWQVIGTGFLPDMDEGGFVLDYWTPTGTSLGETDRQLHAVERILREDPDVAAFTRRTGSELGLFATAPNTGDLTVLLRPRGERKASVYQIMDRLRGRIESQVPAVRVEFTQVLQDLLGDLAGAPSPVEVKLFHPDVRV
ncbi:MAG TPA: efflux RND transporter permease subunit, partial [Gemmatimonadales bacterium]|nr:efflux RND transporter permease subunit [Gemmatimonadales bacterium]